MAGWSYGGILTNYTIATDGRFKAAISGAGSSNQISMYGTDMYIQQYEQELGPPWKSQELWIKLSYPFFHADRIHTPTLFMGGEKDFNVPLLGSEQMYQALRSLGVDSQLVIYPGQFHGLTTPELQEGSARAVPGLVRAVSAQAARSSRPAGRRSPVPPLSLRLVDVRADHVFRGRDRLFRILVVVEARRVEVAFLRVGGAIAFDGAQMLVGNVVGEMGRRSAGRVIHSGSCRLGSRSLGVA